MLKLRKYRDIPEHCFEELDFVFDKVYVPLKYAREFFDFLIKFKENEFEEYGLNIHGKNIYQQRIGRHMLFTNDINYCQKGLIKQWTFDNTDNTIKWSYIKKITKNN